jgi:hypothetical protein
MSHVTLPMFWVSLDAGFAGRALVQEVSYRVNVIVYSKVDAIRNQHPLT